jgi:purine-nucleoside phosphorylase
MYICAGDIEQFSFAKSVGIGLVNVSINLTKLCMEQKPKELIFVGTAGSYGDKKIFDIVESYTATQIENSFFTHNSYTPLEQMVSIYDDIVSHETIVNSSNYITTNKEVAKEYLKKGIDIENMEFFAVLQVAKQFGIKAKGIFVVTNYCDENAHRDFLDNRLKGMERLEDRVLRNEF